MNNARQLNIFFALSTELTGFSLVSLYGTGQGENYFQTLKEVLGEAFVETFLNEYEHLLHRNRGVAIPKLIKEQFYNNDKWGPICQNIIKMWYMGNWYELNSVWWQSYMKNGKNQTKVIAKNAFIEGLVWKAMNRHPKSGKQPGYGTWAFGPTEEKIV